MLSLPRDATVVDIKRSFFKLSKDVHPDKNRNFKANEAFNVLHNAKETLSDPQVPEGLCPVRVWASTCAWPYARFCTRQWAHGYGNMCVATHVPLSPCPAGARGVCAGAPAKGPDLFARVVPYNGEGGQSKRSWRQGVGTVDGAQGPRLTPVLGIESRRDIAEERRMVDTTSELPT